MEQNRTFIKITNKDVYERILLLEKKLEKAISSAKINSAVIAVIVSLLCAVLAHLLS